MIFDFDAPDCPDPLPSDVCIIGAGAGGILLATQLLGAGLRVTLLEGGGLSFEKESQEIYSSEVTGLPYRGVHYGRFRRLGGSTTEWGGQILELDETDFVTRAWVPGSGWPFPKSALASYYRRALDFVGLGRVQKDGSAIWKAVGRQPPDFSPELSLAFSMWCPERNFFQLQHYPITSSRKLAVFCHANATDLILNEARNAITAVKIRALGNRTATVVAQNFVFCLGGIETTRFLLQRPSTGAVPWHSSGVLGKHYQDHIVCNGIPVTDLALDAPHEYFGYISSQCFKYHNKMLLSTREQKTNCTLNVAGTIGPYGRPNDSLDRAYRILRRMRGGAERIPPADILTVARHLPSVAYDRASRWLQGDSQPWKRMMLSVHSEQCPLSASSISLSNERDRLGMLRTRLDWRISREEIHTIRTYVRICESVFRRQAFARLDIPAGFYDDDAVVVGMCTDNFHHMGSTRMSSDPSAGVVDPDLRLHGISNGYVCSSSVFPSSGFSNPTHTLLALGIRLADRLAQQSGRPYPVSASLDGGTSSPVATATRVIKLPGSGGRMTTQLGFGCAYLSTARTQETKSRRLLDAAWDAGIRHFDVAPFYGNGGTEALLGEFLREHPDASVTTKYGLLPPTSAERVARRIRRQIPGLKQRLTHLNPRKGRFDGHEARLFLERSLRRLNREFIDMFLLHEPEVGDLVHDDLLEFLHMAKAQGKIGEFGIGGEYRHIPDLYANRKEYCRILQFEWSILGPPLTIPDSYRIHYRVFAKASRTLSQRFDRDPDLARRWSDATGTDLAEPAVLSRLLLRVALDVWPDSPVLFSTANERHIFDNVRAAEEDGLRLPAERLAALIRDESAVWAHSGNGSHD